MDISRRSFLATSGATALALGARGQLPAAERQRGGNSKSKTTFCGFTKSFQDWSIAEVCKRFKEIGLEGLDLTVRKGGHIEPKEAPKQLPIAAKAAAEAGLEISFLSTDITDPDAEAEHVLETAAALGIKKIKLGYYHYQPFGTLTRQLAETQARIATVAKMCKKHGVLPCVHIHSGTNIPSHGTMLYELIKEFRPDEVGAYADMLHMALEGGAEGWRQGLDLLSPWLAIVSVKNFAWKELDRDKYGQQRWKALTVPVADGVSPVPEFVATLKKAGYFGVYSMHSEYKGKSSFKDLNTEECLKQTAADLKFFKALFE